MDSHKPQNAREGLVIAVLQTYGQGKYERFKSAVARFFDKYGDRVWGMEVNNFTCWNIVNCTARMSKETFEKIAQARIEYVKGRGWRVIASLNIPKELVGIVDEIVIAPSQRYEQ